MNVLTVIKGAVHRAYALLLALMGMSGVCAQSYADIDIEAVLADTVGIMNAFSSWSIKQSITLPECAHPDSNFLRFPVGESYEMARFVEKMDSVLLFRKGRVNILHIGGSHVQADMYTHVFRLNVDSLNGELMPPRGMLFPYTVAKTNNPSNYRVCYGGEWTSARNALRQFDLPQGLCGILAHTVDTTAWFSVDLNPDSTLRWMTTHLHILCSSTQGRSYPALLLSDSTVLKPVKEPTGYRFDLEEPLGRFMVQVVYDSLQVQRPDTFVLNGIFADNDEPGIVYSTIGVNGASVPSYLGCVNFERDLALIKPDLAIFAIGINDATGPHFTDSLFVANYDSLLNRIRNVAPECAFLFITNNDSFRRSKRRYYVNTNGEVARDGFYQLARQWQSPVWDLYEIMGGQSSMQQWQNDHLAQRDKVHFTKDGYLVVGQLFYNAFLDFYLNSDIKI